MRLRHRRRPETQISQRRERGALVVEMAIVALFLVMLLAGGYDLGMGWRAGLALTEGARAGARVGSAVGTNVNADRELLLSVRSALASSGMLDSVTRVVVFRSGDDGRVPDLCKTTTGNRSGCNVLSGEQLVDLTAESDLNDAGCIEESISRGFCPTDREDIPASADSIGIWISAEHENLFPLLGESQTIERTTVMRIEPRESQEGS